MIKQEELSSRKMTSMPNSSPMQNPTDNVATSIQQLSHKASTSITSNVINSSVEKKEDSLRHIKEPTSVNDSTTQKLSVDVLDSVKSIPNFNSKESSNRNFAKRMVAFQKEGKLFSREEKEKIGQSNTELKPPSTGKHSSLQMSWKSEYSVSNEALKPAGSIFGLNPSLSKTTINQHYGTYPSLVGGIRDPSKFEPDQSIRIQPPSSRPSNVFGSSTDPSESCGTQVQAEPMNEHFMPFGTTSKTVRNYLGASKVVKSNESIQTPCKRKLSEDEVQICSCVESATIDGANKCSHSGPNAIHLNMDNVMRFLTNNER